MLCVYIYTQAGEAVSTSRGFTITSVQPPSGPTIYGNYTVTDSFPDNQSLQDFQIRLFYNQNTGPDPKGGNDQGVDCN